MGVAALQNQQHVAAVDLVQQAIAVSQQHILKIYNLPHYRRLREQAISRLHVARCNRCTFR